MTRVSMKTTAVAAIAMEISNAKCVIVGAPLSYVQASHGENSEIQSNRRGPQTILWSQRGHIRTNQEFQNHKRAKAQRMPRKQSPDKVALDLSGPVAAPERA